MKQLLLGFLLMFAAGVMPAHADSANSIRCVASVIDGDTIQIHGKRIRLHGIDAPEGAQNCQRLKQHYVAMTRPTHLFCLAVREDALTEDDMRLLKDRGWKLIRVRAGDRE